MFARAVVMDDAVYVLWLDPKLFSLIGPPASAPALR